MTGRAWMGRAWRVAGTAAALAIVTGCHQSRYINVYAQDPAPDPARAQEASPPGPGTQPFFLGGALPGERRIDTAAICGDGRVEEIYTGRSFGQGFLRMLTAGIYAPYTGQTRCTWHWR